MTRCGYGCPQAPAEWLNSSMLFASHGSTSNLRLRGARGSYRLIDCESGSGDHQLGAGEPALAAAGVEPRFGSLARTRKAEQGSPPRWCDGSPRPAPTSQTDW